MTELTDTQKRIGYYVAGALEDGRMNIVPVCVGACKYRLEGESYFADSEDKKGHCQMLAKMFFKHLSRLTGIDFMAMASEQQTDYAVTEPMYALAVELTDELLAYLKPLIVYGYQAHAEDRIKNIERL